MKFLALQIKAIYSKGNKQFFQAWLIVRYSPECPDEHGAYFSRLPEDGLVSVDGQPAAVGDLHLDTLTCLHPDVRVVAKPAVGMAH